MVKKRGKLKNRSQSVTSLSSFLFPKSGSKRAVSDFRGLEKLNDSLDRLQLLLEWFERKPSGSMLDVLKSFEAFIKRNNWRVFWEIPGNKFVHNPEEIAKTILHAFLEKEYCDNAFIDSRPLKTKPPSPKLAGTPV